MAQILNAICAPQAGPVHEVVWKLLRKTFPGRIRMMCYENSSPMSVVRLYSRSGLFCAPPVVVSADEVTLR